MNDVIGEDPSYAPDFLELAAAAEDRSLQGIATSWPDVAQGAERLLDRCKDLRAMTWLAVAKARTHGWVGAKDGLAAYVHFVEHFWVDAYPRTRARARANFVAALWDGLARALAEVDAGRDELAALDELVAALDSALGDRLGDQNPGAKALRSLVRERLRACPEAPAPPPAPVEATTEPAAEIEPEPRPLPAPPPPEPPSAPAVSDLAGVREALRALAREARNADVGAPQAYRWARIAAWLGIDELPETEGALTRVRPPREDDRLELEGLARAQDWPALVETAEQLLERNIWWLELHAFSSLGLSRLGGPHDRAARAVRQEVRSFVARLPGVEALLFEDGTPLASPETQALLGGAADEGDIVGRHLPAPPVSDGVEALLASALQRSGRARFEGVLAAIELATRQGKPRVARALCETLLPEVNVTLEAWEPAICGRFFSSYLAALEETDDPLRDALLRRLLTTDPTQASRI